MTTMFPITRDMVSSFTTGALGTLTFGTYNQIQIIEQFRLESKKQENRLKADEHRIKQYVKERDEQIKQKFEQQKIDLAKMIEDSRKEKKSNWW